MVSNTYVIIPVFNEAFAVKNVIDSVLKTYPNVVCVNDGSTDQSMEIIKNTKAHLVNHPVNLGAGAALQTGIDFALLDKKAKYFITIDADGQHNIEDATSMLKFLEKNKIDIVIGSRFWGKTQNMTIFKKTLLKLAAIFSSSVSGVNLSDPHIGLRVFNRKFAEKLNLSMPDFSHASELVDRIKENKNSYAEMPVTVTYTKYSKSKGQPMLNAVNISFDVLINKLLKRDVN